MGLLLILLLSILAATQVRGIWPDGLVWCVAIAAVFTSIAVAMASNNGVFVDAAFNELVAGILLNFAVKFVTFAVPFLVVRGIMSLLRRRRSTAPALPAAAPDSE